MDWGIVEMRRTRAVVINQLGEGPIASQAGKGVGRVGQGAAIVVVLGTKSARGDAG